MGGASGVTVRRLAPAEAGSLRLRVLSALVLAPLPLIAIWFGGPLLPILTILAAVVMAWEWGRLCGGAGLTIDANVDLKPIQMEVRAFRSSVSFAPNDVSARSSTNRFVRSFDPQIGVVSSWPDTAICVRMIDVLCVCNSHLFSGLAPFFIDPRA